MNIFQIEDWPQLFYRGVLFDISQGRLPNLVCTYNLYFLSDWGFGVLETRVPKLVKKKLRKIKEKCVK